MKWIKSFSFRLVAVTVLMFVLSISAVVTLISAQYRLTMRDQDETTTLNAFAVAETNIINLLNDAGNTALKIQRLKAVDSYLFDEFGSELEHVVASRNMMNAISEHLSMTDGLYGVLFFRPDASVVGAMVPWRFCLETGAHPFYTLAKLDERELSTGMTWLGAYPAQEFTLRDYSLKGSGDVLVIGANKTRYKDGDLKGGSIVMLAAVSDTALSSLFTYLGDEQSSIYLLDAEGKQISGPENAKVNLRPDFADTLLEQEADGSFRYISGTESTQVIHYRLNSLNWTLVKTVPMQIYNEPMHQLLLETAVITLLAVIVVCVIYIGWLTNIIKPIKVIRADLERVRNGDISVRMHQGFDMVEFEELRVGTNRMIESVSDMICQTKEMERSRAELTLRNLQMQINPHMVFNTISAIRWMATFAGAQTVADMLMELAELIRPIYSEWRVQWTVREELDYIRHYMRLIELRYGSGFQVVMDVDESIMDAKIPLFTLQPLMENSCEHGAHQRKALRISISGRREGEDGVLLVQDNGCGISPDMLEAINGSMKSGKALERKQLRHTGMGIVNIDKRVKMFSGDAYGLSIDSKVDEGTWITVRFRLL